VRVNSMLKATSPRHSVERISLSGAHGSGMGGLAEWAGESKSVSHALDDAHCSPSRLAQGTRGQRIGTHSFDAP